MRTGNTLLNLANLSRKKKEKQTFLEKALEKLQKAEELAPGTAAYDLACAHSLMGERENAYAWLEKAIEGDDKSCSMAKGDDDFRFINQEPRFKALTKQLPDSN